MPSLDEQIQNISANSASVTPHEVLSQLRLLHEKFDSISISQLRTEAGVGSIKSDVAGIAISISQAYERPESPSGRRVSLEGAGSLVPKKGSRQIKKTFALPSSKQSLCDEYGIASCQENTMLPTMNTVSVSESLSSVCPTRTSVSQQSIDGWPAAAELSAYQKRHTGLEFRECWNHCRDRKLRADSTPSPYIIKRGMVRGSVLGIRPWVPDHRSLINFGIWSSMPKHLPLAADSLFKVLWDSLSIVMLLNDAIMVPYLIAWEKSLVGIFWVNAWFTATFWTLDVVLNFMTCVTVHDVIVRSWKGIFAHYVKGWFALDAIVLLSDWISIVVDAISRGDSTTPTWVKLARFLKASRLFRVVEMVKMGRFAQINEMILQWARSKGVVSIINFLLRMSRMILLILWMNHVGACLWYRTTMGDWADTDTCTDWKRVHIKGVLAQCGRAYKGELPERYYYLSGLYWSVTAMFSGASTTPPTNSWENALASTFVVFGMLFGSCVISSLTAILIDFNLTKRDRMLQIRTLQIYLHQHNIHPLLCVHVLNQARQRLKVEKRLTDQDVPVIALLSTELRAQLRRCLCAPLLRQHSLIFSTCSYLYDNFIKLVCNSCVEHKAMRPGEELFKEGADISHIYLLVTGKMHYLIGEVGADSPGSILEQHSLRKRAQQARMNTMSLEDHAEYDYDSPFRPNEQEAVGPRWILEIALWCKWSTLGSMEASDSCELLSINVTEFASVVSGNHSVALVMTEFGGALMKFVEDEKPANFNDLDLGIEFDLIVGMMSEDSRSCISQPALESLRLGKFFAELRPDSSRSLDDKLTDEVNAGVCVLRHTPSGGVIRVAQVVAIQLMRNDDRMLVKVGSIRDGVVHPSVCLPGTKMKGGGSPLTCAQVHVEEDLSYPTVASRLTFSHVEMEEKKSTKYEIATKYVRTVFCASIDEATAAEPHEYLQFTESDDTDDVEMFIVRAFVPETSASCDAETYGDAERSKGNDKLFAWLKPSELRQAGSSGKGNEMVMRLVEQFERRVVKVVPCALVQQGFVQEQDVMVVLSKVDSLELPQSRTSFPGSEMTGM